MIGADCRLLVNIPVEAQHCFTKALLQVARMGPRSTHLPTSQMQKRLGGVPKHMLLCIYIHVYCQICLACWTALLLFTINMSIITLIMTIIHISMFILLLITIRIMTLLLLLRLLLLLLLLMMMMIQDYIITIITYHNMVLFVYFCNENPTNNAPVPWIRGTSRSTSTGATEVWGTPQGWFPPAVVNTLSHWGEYGETMGTFLSHSEKTCGLIGEFMGLQTCLFGD